MLAHELRNPLAPISAGAQLLQTGQASDAVVQRTAAIIVRQVHHMTRLVDDLLDVSRVTRGLVTLARAPLDVRAIVADAVEQAQPLMDARQHRFDVALPAFPADGQRRPKAAGAGAGQCAQ
jgi:signal transduction histidine kinase